MVYRQKRTRYSLIAFVIILLTFIAVSTFIEIPLSVKTVSEVFPGEKWLLTRGKSGEIVSNLIDFTNGHTAQYDISQFERGEFISVNLSDFLKNKKKLASGDTVVLMKSSNVQDQLVTAEGDLEVALANLKSQSSAQKKPLISEAENKLRYSEEKLEQQKVLYNRTKQLYEKELCSRQEYETQKWNLDLLGIECRINSAQLENLTTGVKPEEITYLESQISSYKKKLKFLKERGKSLLIKAPISGEISPSFSPDTLINVSNIRTVVLHMPVKLADLPLLKEGQKLPVTFTNFPGVSYRGQIISVGKEVKLLTGQQAVFISVIIKNNPGTLLPGMILESSMQTGRINLFSHLLRLLMQ